MCQRQVEHTVETQLEYPNPKAWHSSDNSDDTCGKQTCKLQPCDGVIWNVL